MRERPNIWLGVTGVSKILETSVLLKCSQVVCGCFTDILGRIAVKLHVKSN